MIAVGRPHKPDIDKLKSYMDKIYDSDRFSNNGPLFKELELRLKKYLGVKNIILTSSGGVAMQLAYKLLELKGEVITTPFSFAATASTLKWQGLTPVFADIDLETFNIKPQNIESLISEKTSAILPVHVFGNPCNVDEIEKIAKRNNLDVVYDAAHCFKVDYNGSSILNRGSISTVSFHATKVFHTVEGGAIITNDDELAAKARKMTNFGITANGIETEGINAKMNELEAAMGLCVLDEIDCVIGQRKKIWERYHAQLNGFVEFQKLNDNTSFNYCYAPILLKNEKQVLKVCEQLEKESIYPKRYFYPSLDLLPYLQNSNHCANSQNISSRILCLPIYSELTLKQAEQIINVVKLALNN